MNRTGINQRNKGRSTRRLSLHSWLCVTALLTVPARLAPPALGSHSPALPSSGLTKDLLGSSSGWLGSSCQTPSQFHRGGKTAFFHVLASGASRSWRPGLGLGKLGRATTKSPWQQSPWHHPPLTRPAPTNWSAHAGMVTNCLSVWQTLPTGLCPGAGCKGSPEPSPFTEGLENHLPSRTRRRAQVQMRTGGAPGRAHRGARPTSPGEGPALHPGGATLCCMP